MIDKFVTEKTTVEKVANLSDREFVSCYLDRLQPVVITDAISSWKAFSTWTPKFLQQTYGSKQVTVDDRSYQLLDFIDLVLTSTKSHPCSYLNVDIPGLFPELLPDISPSLLYPQHNWLLNPMLYIPSVDSVKQQNGFLTLLIAGEGTRFPVLHFDHFHLHAFIMQIYGDKEFTLFPPHQSEYLYPLDRYSNQSFIPDVDRPDLNRFPLFAKAVPIKVILKPGETIFMPSGWWHTTRMLTPSIAVTSNSLSSSNWDKFSQDLTRESAKNSLTSTNKESDISAYLNELGILLAQSVK
ncbi:cupin-like domain-containing protein [Chamaesiphon polymorphus]|uniref:JmjC domain-containing protein n=1 Tax=Chamaesiphon polymorphus CCALA 037 TaxID=2107692 RepID=A0A2T1GCV0_9CYAN|nr:cupin-like domain-containing protein [Chamaesiphon polymorphus]PSB55140.1 hypothetical protein C7B77_15970 [Chamaesiphon polymorphus CCALA 037]